MPVTYLQSYMENTFCEDGSCMLMKELCDLKDNELQCLENYGVPGGIMVANVSRRPIKKGKTQIINDEMYENLYNSTSGKNKTRKRNDGNKRKKTKKVLHK